MSMVRASLFRRLAALIYDFFLLAAISFLYGVIMTLILVQWHSWQGTPAPHNGEAMFNHWFFSLSWWASLSMFYIWFWRKSGQTLGMRTWRICMRQRLAPDALPTWRQCITRALISPLLIGLGGLGYWYAFFNKHHDCLHDIASNTLVVYDPGTQKSNN